MLLTQAVAHLMPTHRFVQVLRKTSRARLDPCCGGYRSATHETKTLDPQLYCLNPCCGGYRSATCESELSTNCLTRLNPCCGGYRSATVGNYVELAAVQPSQSLLWWI